jgi:hypothetical protein
MLRQVLMVGDRSGCTDGCVDVVPTTFRGGDNSIDRFAMCLKSPWNPPWVPRSMFSLTAWMLAKAWSVFFASTDWSCDAAWLQLHDIGI